MRRVTVTPKTSILETIQVINQNAMGIALVIDGDRLAGTVTDGDIRRGILRNIPLGSSVTEVMNPEPIVAREGQTRGEIRSLMRHHKIRQVAVLDAAGRYLRMELLESRYDNPVVIMAGGLGTRLRPLTYDCPKPLLKINGKPILEIILETLEEQGFRDIYISVNYQADKIISYFGDRVKYLTEGEQMGTAGSLSLLPEPKEPVLVINGDLLTRVNYNRLLDYHTESGAGATMCVKEHRVPYGVVKSDNHRVVGLEEKPLLFINAGIYVLEPETVKKVWGHTDMPTLIGRVDTAVFPIREYWLDIGRHDDFEQASFDYKEVFVPDNGQGRVPESSEEEYSDSGRETLDRLDD